MHTARKQFASALALVVVALVGAGDAGALVQRTFVSGLGADTNPCTRAEPCRTFAAAIGQTQAGGEVVALDSAGYGPVTITEAISLISPPGVYAGVTTIGFADAITVTAGANDVVVLKGLSLSGLGVGDDGITFNSGKALRVEGLTISGFTSVGIVFNPAATARLSVTDSTLRDIGNAGIYAIAPAGQLARVAIDRTRLVGTSQGIHASGNSRVTVRDSLAADNASVGFYAAAATAVVNLESCLAANNAYGIYSSGLIRVAGTTVSENGTGLFVSAGGSIVSRGNNTVEGNGTDGVFTGAFAAK